MAKGRHDLARALDRLYELARELGYGDPLFSFLNVAQKLLKSEIKDEKSLIKYMKLSGYGGREIFSTGAWEKRVVRRSKVPYLDALRMVNPGVAIAAIELVRHGRILPYATWMGPGYVLVLDTARLILADWWDFESDLVRDQPPDVATLPEELAILAALLGPNYPLAVHYLGGKQLVIPEERPYPVTKANPSLLISTAIAEAIDSHIERMFTSASDVPNDEVLLYLERLANLASKRAKLVKKQIGSARSDREAKP